MNHNFQNELVEELRDLLSAEKQILKALPKMAKKASSAKLKEAFEIHKEETEKQVQRLEEVFQSLDLKPRAKTCEGIKGIIEEGEEMMSKEVTPEVLDALLIATAQKVEHYEIASYGTICSWAELLGLTEIKDLLGETLSEEEQTDKNLTKLSKSVNKKAIGQAA